MAAETPFWQTTIDCLYHFHKMNLATAQIKVKDYKSKFASCSKDEKDLILHMEPFEMANEIANVFLDITKYKKEYNNLLKRNGW